jgi:hypothetical protein
MGIRDINISVETGNSDSMKATKIGNSKCEVNHINGEKFTVMLNDVKYVPILCVKVFSLNKASNKGFKFSNHGVIFILNYNHLKLTFSSVINAMDGCVTGALVKPITINNINRFANASII